MSEMPPPGDGHPPAPSATPLLDISAILNADRALFSAQFPTVIASHYPSVAEHFPKDPASIIDSLLDALRYIFHATQVAASQPESFGDLVEFLAQLGRDHRKLQLEGVHFDLFRSALSDALARVGGPLWTEQLHQVFNDVMLSSSAIMLAAIHEEPQPWVYGGTVVETIRKNRDSLVVRIMTDQPIPYRAGQYLSVQTPFEPQLWRNLSPSIPSNSASQLEFHIRAVGDNSWSSLAVRTTSVGDRWVMAHPLGKLNLDPLPGYGQNQDILMIAGGTGIAPLRSLILEHAMRPDPPRVHVFYAGRFPGDLYDLDTLVDISATNPWLIVQPVVESLTNPWWIDHDPRAVLPSSIHHMKIGTAVEAVTEFGNWSDRKILVSGSPAMISATVEGLVAKGTPREHIFFDPYRT